MSLARRQQQALDAILERSAHDSDFRRELLTDPRQAIERCFGVMIPARFKIRFIEKDPDLDALVVLPDLQSANGELSDADLHAVSGGGDPPTW